MKTQRWPDPIHRAFLTLRREERAEGPRQRREWSKRKCREIARREIERARSKDL